MIFVNMAVFSISSCIILCFILDVSGTETAEEALLFDRFTGSVLLLPKGLSKETCGAWATACPVPESARGDLLKNAVLVNEIYHKGSRKQYEIEIKVCKESYKVALVFDYTDMRFAFGYAIYFEMRDEEFIRRSNLKRFTTPAEITRLMREYSTKKGNILLDEGFNIANAARNDDSVRNEDIWYNGDQKLEFLWMRLFSLKFDFRNKILKKIVYQILPNNKWPVGERCEDYSLGSEVYEETDVNYFDNLYSKENQNRILKNIKIPKRTRTEDGVSSIPTPCEQNKICLSKWLLIPMDQFIFGSTTSPVCSNLATIPIWTDKVEKVLKKVDQYLYALYRVLSGPLHITSGVTNEVLELPVDTGGWSNKNSKIFLDPAKGKIPVPKIIYKIVKYRVPGSVWRSAIIVIHNDPYYKKSARICKDVTTEWGWQSITNDGEFDNVYVCKHGDKVLRKIFRICPLAKKIPTDAEFNLPKFQVPVEGGERFLDLKKEADEEFELLTRHGAAVVQNQTDGVLVRDGAGSRDDGDEVYDDAKLDVENIGE